jgi:hypothetical protein
LKLSKVLEQIAVFTIFSPQFAGISLKNGKTADGKGALAEFA